jgi:hypothetical protein
MIKYRAEWTDILGLDWKVDLSDVNYNGSITTLQATGNPLVIEYLSSSQELLEGPIRGSRADLKVYSDADFTLIDLYTVQDQQYKMSVYYYSGTDILFWEGYVMADNYSEPYSHTSYEVIISASDGLGVLKNILFDNAGTPYIGRISIREIIIDILAKINIITFGEFVNIYETHHSNGVGDSPLDQTFINVDVFKDMYCYEVLENILKSFNANIRQINATITIYRPTELSQDLIYGRIFTAATKTSTTFAPQQFIKRDTVTSDIIDTEGGTMLMSSPAKKVTIHQDYGNKESWIDNWEFKSNTYQPTPIFKYKEWTYAGGYGIAPISNQIRTDTDGWAMFTNANNPSTVYIYQDFGWNAVVSSNVFNIEFEYLVYNPFAINKTIIFNLTLMDSGGHKMLYIYDATEARWQISAFYTFTETALPGSSGWKSHKRTINGIQYVGPYRITLYGPSGDLGITLGIKNVKFYSTSDEIVVKKTPHKGPFPRLSRWILKMPKYISTYLDNIETVQSIYNPAISVTSGKTLDYDYILGDVIDANLDNVVEQLAGAFSLSDVTKTAVWNTRGGSESKPVLQIIGDEIAQQYGRPKQIITLPVLEGDTINTPHINVMGRFEDPLNQIMATNRKFVFNSGLFNIADRSWNLNLIEILYNPPQGIEGLMDESGNYIFTEASDYIIV